MLHYTCSSWRICLALATITGAVLFLVAGCADSPTPSSGELVSSPVEREALAETETTTPLPTVTSRPSSTPTLTSTATFTPQPTSTPTLALPVKVGTPYPASGDILSADNVADLTMLAQWGSGQAGQVAWSPDGQLLAVASTGGCYLYDAQTLEEKGFLAIEGDDRTPHAQALVFSPDSRWLAVGVEGIIAVPVLDVASGKMVFSVPADANDVAFSPDGKLIALAVRHVPRVSIWDLEERAFFTSFTWDTLGDVTEATAVAFSPDGRLLAAADHDGLVVLWDRETDTILNTWRLEDQVLDVAFSPDGQLLAAGGWDFRLTVWDLQSGEQRFSRDMDAWVQQLAFAGNDRLYVSLTNAGVATFDLQTGQSEPFLSPEDASDLLQGDVYIALSPDGSALATVQEGGSIATWDAETGEMFQSVFRSVGSIQSLALSADGQLLALGGDRNVLLWNALTGAPLAVLQEHRYDVERVALSPDGRWLASSGEDAMLLLWDAQRGELVHTLRPFQDYSINTVRGMAFSPDSRQLFSAAYNESQVEVWDVESGQVVRTLPGVEDAEALVISPDGRMLAVASMERVLLVDVESGAVQYSLPDPSFPLPLEQVFSLAFSPDGSVLATGALITGVALFDTASGELANMFETLSGNALAFSPDGRLLAIGSTALGLVVWDVENSEVVYASPWEDAVVDVAFAPDGKAVYVAFRDGRVGVLGLTP